MAVQARQEAETLGLDLKRAPINPDFTDWPYLADYVGKAGAVIIWLAPGPSAAPAKVAKARNPEAIFLTGSLNATNGKPVALSGGAWNGIIFPAVLRPSREIPEAYGSLIRKYGR